MDGQSQQPSNVQPQNGGEQERRSRDRTPRAPPVVVEDQSNVRASASRRKRSRKASRPTPVATPRPPVAAVPAQVTASGNVVVLQAVSGPPSGSPPAFMINPVVQLQPRPAPFVQPSFQFFTDQNLQQPQFFNMSSNPPPPQSQAFEELSDLIKQYQGEVEGYLRAHDEQLRRTLAEKWQRHSRTILCATEEAAARRIREKEAEAENAARQCAELEEMLAHARAEVLAWQSKAAAEFTNAVAARNDAAALRTQLERVTGGAAEGAGEGGLGAVVDDAESAHVDVFPVPPGACHICRRGSAVVAMVPCGHVCLCTECDAAHAAEICPCCSTLSHGTMRIYFG